MIPSTGLESAPADILAWSLVKRVREDFSSPTRQINSTIKEIKCVTPWLDHSISNPIPVDPLVLAAVR